MGVVVLGVAVAAHSARKNTTTPTHRLFTKRPVFPVYAYIQGDANV
jgi:hypothetical protein